MFFFFIYPDTELSGFPESLIAILISFIQYVEWSMGILFFVFKQASLLASWNAALCDSLFMTWTYVNEGNRIKKFWMNKLESCS